MVQKPFLFGFVFTSEERSSSQSVDEDTRRTPDSGKLSLAQLLAAVSLLSTGSLALRLESKALAQAALP